MADNSKAMTERELRNMEGDATNLKLWYARTGDVLPSMIHGADDGVFKLTKEIRRLCAENGRLRAALTDMVDVAKSWGRLINNDWGGEDAKKCLHAKQLLAELREVKP